LSQPSESIVRRLTTSVASSGTRSVERNTHEQDAAAGEVEHRERIGRQHRGDRLEQVTTIATTRS
jgi:hypothetical protein